MNFKVQEGMIFYQKKLWNHLNYNFSPCKLIYENGENSIIISR